MLIFCSELFEKIEIKAILKKSWSKQEKNQNGDRF